MSQLILGLHVGHNSSACIGDASGIRFAIQEERLNGEKNYWGIPRKSIMACMDAVGAKPGDISAVAVGSKMSLHRYHSRDDVLYSFARQGTWSGYVRARFLLSLATFLLKNHGQPEIRQALSELSLGECSVKFFDHHRTHAATAYYGLRRDVDTPLLVLTCDGSGDKVSASVRVWDGSGEKVLAVTDFRDSLGAIYSNITFAMGFVPFEHEYKLMGMAPYAPPSAAEKEAQIFYRFLDLAPDGLRFRRKTGAPTFAIQRKLFDAIEGKRFDYICAGLQHFTEDMLTRWARNAVAKSGIKQVVAAGGVFMNVKANKSIAALPEVENFEAFPSCGDESLSLGAYYLEAAEQFGAAQVKALHDYYLGDDLDAAETVAALNAAGFSFSKPENIADAVADLLVAGHPVARCAGRMEFGARALGNRSILADPSNPDVVRIINQMVKKRDFWMPFAPMVMASRQHTYIKNEKNLRSPYMMMTFDTRDNYPELIAAVQNADLTSRAQILEPEHNPAMHAILEAYETKTGRGVILNTSFNLHGFPIVRTAAEALHVFANSGLEYMQVGDYLVSKSR